MSCVNPVLNESVYSLIDYLDVGTRTRVANCLKYSYPKVRSIGDLVQLSRTELINTPNAGKKSIAELERVLADRGLKLGTRPFLLRIDPTGLAAKINANTEFSDAEKQFILDCISAAAAP
jgi:hypothetical protein